MILMEENEEEKKKSLDDGERGDWKSWSETQHLKTLRSWHLVPWFYGKWKVERVEAVTDFIFLGSKMYVDFDCSYVIKDNWIWKGSYDNLRQLIKIHW